ncbi:MAG: UDP-2,3-diacylglucosamine diphosphatase LpxI, partial [Leptospiraceae bacterium]|nr:UDP-2,3-diacylglucosamine diphosphatase LpxI [Leptospiraceae bacterium]
VLTRLYSSVFRSFRRHGIKRLLLLGKATRDILYNKPRFDVRTVLLLARMLSQSDYALFENVAREVDKLGITIINQDEYLQHLFLQPGRYGKKLTTEQLKDIEFGLQHAREMNRLDIGQTVVVGKRSVLAVEAAEGTDQCIVRGGDLFHNKGAVVCKLSKEQHDLRFDIPATGSATLDSMARSGCRVLAFDSRRTFVVIPSEFIRSARNANITVLAVDAGQRTDLAYLKKLNGRAASLP